MTIRFFLLASAAAFLPMPALAQTVAPADVSAEADAEIVVFGAGEARQVQEIRQHDLAILVPGTSPLKAIAKLPGVNFQSADAFGNYEWSERISIRGFNQQQLGFTLDGIPLGDFSYGNNNGLHISRAISPENIGSTAVSQGAGSTSTASTNNLGGTVTFTSRDPSEVFGADIEATYGEQDTIRGFARIDSGDLGGGVRGYLSYGYLTTDKWKGVGKQKQHVANAKLVAPIGDAKLTGYFSFSDRREADYQDLSLNMIERLGYRNDNISDNIALALRIAQVGANRGDTGATPTNPAAGTVYPAPYATVDDVYYDAAGLRQDYLGALRLDAPLAEGLEFHMTGYYHSNHGAGLWWTPYVPSPNGSQISQRTTEYDIRRGGVFGSLDWETDNNKLSVGGWYEKNKFRQARRFYSVDPATADGSDHLVFPKNPFFTQWEYRFNTETIQLFAEDRFEIGDLTLTVGNKGYKVTNKAKPIVAGSLASGEIGVTDWFQPSAGAVYKVGGGELFAGFTQVTRAYPSASTAGPFATTPAGFASLKLKPEESDTYEGGYRFRTGGFSGVVAAYLVEFRNRLLSFANGAGIVGNPAILQNVGGVESYGVEATGQFRLTSALSLFASYAYNHSEYQDDVLNANGTVRSAIKGKAVVDAPRSVATGEIAYDDQSIFGRIGANYMSRRYFTYTNDQSVKGRVLIDASIGYRFTGSGPLHGLEIQGNVTNLLDKKYVATIGSNGFGDASTTRRSSRVRRRPSSSP